MNRTESNRHRPALLATLVASLSFLLALPVPPARALSEARVTVYTDREAFLEASGALVATDGAGGLEGQLPWRGRVDSEGADLLIGAIRFRGPAEGEVFVGTESVHGDWSPSIPGPDLAVPPGSTLEIGLVNPARRSWVIGIDLATSGEVPVRLEIALVSDGEILHAFEHEVPPGGPAFLGVWSDTLFEALRIRQAGAEDSPDARTFFGPVYVSDESFAAAPRTLTPTHMATAGFGTSVAVSGNVAVVGAPGGNEVAASSGSAYVFERDEGGTDNWGEVKHLLASDAEAFDKFGEAVAASADVIAVGALDEDETDSNAGAVYVFQRDHGGIGNWGEVKKLLASDGAATDRFGTSVAASGELVVVGSPGDDNPSGGSGSAYVFARNAGGPDNWGEVKKLRPSASSPGIDFGDAVAVSGTRIVVGARGNTAGTLYVFERDAGGAENWGEVATLTASDATSGDSFGELTALDGRFVVGGAPDHEHASVDAGSAYVFERGSGTWSEVEELLPQSPLSNDDFGDAVSVSGDVILVGVPLDDDNADAAGSAYLYERDAGGGGWSQVDKATDPTPVGSDRFGTSVAVSGDVAAIGAPGAGTQGEAVIFALRGPCSDIVPTGLVLTSPTVQSTELFEACYTIDAFARFGVGGSGDVTLRAGRRVVLGDGFFVASGGSLVVEIDPAVGN